MKKLIGAGLCLMLVFTNVSRADATYTSGSSCKKAGLSAVQNNYQFTCVKKGKKLVWQSSYIFSAPFIDQSGVDTALVDGKMRVTISWSGKDSNQVAFPADTSLEVFVDSVDQHMTVQSNGTPLVIDLDNSDHNLQIMTGAKYGGTTSTPILLKKMFTPLPQGFLVHAELSNILNNLQLKYADSITQSNIESGITNKESFDTVVEGLVASAKRIYPGIAAQITSKTSVLELIRPWASQLAASRGQSSDTFFDVNEGFIQRILKSPTTIDQAGFNALLNQYQDFATSLNAIDDAYWMFVVPNWGTSAADYKYRDALFASNDLSAARGTYTGYIQGEAKVLFKDYAFRVDMGETTNQFESFWVSRFASILGIPVGAIVPKNEPILIRAALTPGLQTSTFDYWVKQDPRWLNTSSAVNGLMGTANQLLCAFGLSALGCPKH